MIIQILNLATINDDLEMELIRNHTQNMVSLIEVTEQYERQSTVLTKTEVNLQDKSQKLTFCKEHLDETESDYLKCIIPSLEMNGSFYGSESLLKPTEDKHPSISKLLAIDGEYFCPNLWNYKNSFFFAATTVTTIGYGNVYPHTSGGKERLFILASISRMSHSKLK